MENKDVPMEPMTPVAPAPATTEQVQYLLNPGQKILKNGRIFWPYFLAFLYNLVLVVALAGLFVLPIIRSDLYTGENPSLVITPLLPLGGKFEGLVSIVDIILANVKNMKEIGDILAVISSMFGLVSFALILVVLVIWFLIKFIHSLIALITCCFKHRKHKIIDNFFFKNTHQYFKLGILDFDFTFIVFFIYALFLLAFMNAKAILATFGIENDIINGIVFMKAFENSELLNFGNIILFSVIGGLFVIRIVYRVFVKLLSKKVKKTYVLKKIKRV